MNLFRTRSCVGKFKSASPCCLFLPICIRTERSPLFRILHYTALQLICEYSNCYKPRVGNFPRENLGVDLCARHGVRRFAHRPCPLSTSLCSDVYFALFYMLLSHCSHFSRNEAWSLNMGDNHFYSTPRKADISRGIYAEIAPLGDVGRYFEI